MSTKKMNTEQGHWLLAKMGKKVLRPGGKELTLALINGLGICDTDSIVEFAPGLGFTAKIALKNNPKSYVGVELNEEAAQILRKEVAGISRSIVIGNASKAPLNDNSYDKVYGEAMLTMQADHQKSRIIREAARLLKKGGFYGIHELGLVPNELRNETKLKIQRELAKVIKVNARPLTETEWKALLEKEGFKIVKVFRNAMRLLEPKRMIQDEGFFRTVKIVCNILTHPKERKRILSMRQVFRKYGNQMNAIAIIAQKT